MRLNYLISTALVVVDASSLKPQLPLLVERFKQLCTHFKLSNGWYFDPLDLAIMNRIENQMKLIDEATQQVRNGVHEIQMFRVACSGFYKGEPLLDETFTAFIHDARNRPEQFVIESLRDIISVVCSTQMDDMDRLPKTRLGFIQMNKGFPISQLGRDELISKDREIQSLLPVTRESHTVLKAICQPLFHR